jgi:hypothetical protein
MAATAGLVLATGLAIKASPAIKAIVINFGQGAAAAAGEVMGHEALEKTRDIFSWRPSATEGTLRDQLAAMGLGSAETFMRLAASASDPALRLQHVKSALDELVRAQDRLAHANVLADEKMWTHQVLVHHLLVFVAYLHESRLGQDRAAGLRAVGIFLPPMFDLFAQKMDWARKALFNSDTKQRRVIDAYETHMTVWEQQLLELKSIMHTGIVRITREHETKMVRSVEIVLPAPALPAGVAALPPTCATCGIGFLVGGNGHCSNPSCDSVAAAAVPSIAPGLAVPAAAAGHALVAAPSPRWEWKADDGSWRAYQPRICALLDEKLALFRQGDRTARHVDIDGQRYCELAKMVQARWDSSSKRAIRRCEPEVWVRHTNSGRAFYRRPRDDMSITLDPPSAGAAVRHKEEAGANAVWFEERWARLVRAPVRQQHQQPPLPPPAIGATAPPPIAVIPTPASTGGSVHRDTVLAAGNDILTQVTTVEQAKAVCATLYGCVGFCFQSSHPNADGQVVQCYFKSVVNRGHAHGWCTFLK